MTPTELTLITYGLLLILIAVMFGLIYWHNERRERKRNHIEWNPTPVRYPDEDEEI